MGKKKKDDITDGDAVREYQEYFDASETSLAKPAPPTVQRQTAGQSASAAFLEQLKAKDRAREAFEAAQATGAVFGGMTAPAPVGAPSGVVGRGPVRVQPAEPFGVLYAGVTQLGVGADTDPAGVLAEANLHLHNLAQNVQEETVVREFGNFGSLGSVRVMPETNHARSLGVGFVSFLFKEDAERAYAALQGKEINGAAISISWGRAVPRPICPLYVPPWDTRDYSVPDGFPRVEVPDEFIGHKLIDTLAQYTVKYGLMFEETIKAREEDNPEFDFLQKPFGEENRKLTYYKWRVFSLLQGDSLHKWRTTPFQMFQGGPAWIPPKVPAGLQQEHEAGKNSGSNVAAPEVKTGLPDGDESALVKMLRELSTSRSSIRDAMVFVMDRAHHASDVAEILMESLTLKETPPQQKLARLYLVSDVLHNSGNQQVKGAAQYRRSFQAALGDVFRSMSSTWKIAGRLSGEKFKDAVKVVLQVWEDAGIYPPENINEWTYAFLTS